MKNDEISQPREQIQYFKTILILSSHNIKENNLNDFDKNSIY